MLQIIYTDMVRIIYQPKLDKFYYIIRSGSEMYKSEVDCQGFMDWLEWRESTNREWQALEPLGLSRIFPQAPEDAIIRNAREARDVKLEVKFDMIKTHVFQRTSEDNDPGESDSQRGDVRGFSRASRKRLIELMASLRYEGGVWFVTLTYPDYFYDNFERWKRDIDVLGKRLAHQFPGWSFIWRMELKKRKSGDNEGKFAPHFHLLLFDNGNDIPEKVAGRGGLFEWFNASWYEIADHGDLRGLDHGVKVSKVNNRRHAYYYISKYVAKEDEDNLAVGRRWGKVGDFNTQAFHTFEMSLRELKHFKRLIASWMKSVDRGYWRVIKSSKEGFTVFGVGDKGQSPQKFIQNIVFRCYVHACELAKMELDALENLMLSGVG